MPYDNVMNEFPGSDDENIIQSSQQGESSTPGEANKPNTFVAIWQNLSRAGLGETVFRAGTHILSVVLVLTVVLAMRAFYGYLQKTSQSAIVQKAAMAAELPTATPIPLSPDLPAFPGNPGRYTAGIPRLALIHTTIPTRPRTEIITYTVQTGDTIWGIAEKFGLKPETVLWGNTYTLADDPHRMQIGTNLNILPLDGTYHKWSTGEGLNGVSKGYGVSPEDIINWAGNHLDVNTLGDWSHPNIEPGTMLLVPGGQRAFVTWSAPFITRTDPAVAKIYGPGFCGTIVDGAVGMGAFIWPSNNHFLSGYDYSPETNHRAIDIAGKLGDALYASDNGVIVYAGWNDRGYGNVVVIDHGNGWQTLYAHLSYFGVNCGQSVYQGDVIGSMGSTGNSSGPHLHFEMRHESYGLVNPWNFLP